LVQSNAAAERDEERVIGRDKRGPELRVIGRGGEQGEFGISETVNAHVRIEPEKLGGLAEGAVVGSPES
jgi:hypothetical protein